MRVFRHAAAIALLALLSACGGSGSNPGAAIPSVNGTANTPIAPSSALIPPNYTIVDLGANVYPNALNASGIVVGHAGASSGDSSYAFIYSNGKLRRLGILPGDSFSAALDINDAGTIVGYSGSNSGSHAVEFTTSGPVNLGNLNGSDRNTAFAINNAGEIVGHAGTSGSIYSEPCDGPAVIFDGHGGVQAIQFLGNAPTDDATPVAINSRGVMVGRVCIPTASSGAYIPFSYPPFETLGPPNATGGYCTFGHPSQSADDINARGDVVGEYCDLDLGAGAFLVKSGVYSTLPNTELSSLNDRD